MPSFCFYDRCVFQLSLTREVEIEQKKDLQFEGLRPNLQEEIKFDSTGFSDDDMPIADEPNPNGHLSSLSPYQNYGLPKQEKTPPSRKESDITEDQIPVEN